MKKINSKENRHKTPRITWFDNRLHPRAMTNKFYYIKFGVIQIGVEALSQIQILNTPNNSLSQIQTKEPNTKYHIRIDRTNKPSCPDDPIRHLRPLGHVMNEGGQVINERIQYLKQLPISCHTVGSSSKPALMSPEALQKKH